MNAHEERMARLAGALAPHQAKYDELDALYRERQELRGRLHVLDELIRQRMVDLYDAMTVQVIQAEIGK